MIDLSFLLAIVGQVMLAVVLVRLWLVGQSNARELAAIKKDLDSIKDHLDIEGEL